jgi:hypothetical protein
VDDARERRPDGHSVGMWSRRLTDGELVTLLVGLGLELAARHRGGAVHGPLHPTHVRVHPDGRPVLLAVAPPPGWTPHDDWVALLRLGRHLGASDRASELAWTRAAAGEDAELLRWLLAWAVPQPLLPAGDWDGSDGWASR